jgi:hypothetical protein
MQELNRSDFKFLKFYYIDDTKNHARTRVGTPWLRFGTANFTATTLHHLPPASKLKFENRKQENNQLQNSLEHQNDAQK